MPLGVSLEMWGSMPQLAGPPFGGIIGYISGNVAQYAPTGWVTLWGHHWVPVWLCHWGPVLGVPLGVFLGILLGAYSGTQLGTRLGRPAAFDTSVSRQLSDRACEPTVRSKT